MIPSRQMPLYPMLDDRDTESSRNNHGKVWNTRKNHLAWRLCLQGTLKGRIPAYAQDVSGLLPAYTFLGDGEPFYAETLRYIGALKSAGIPADVDVYHTDVHAFDMMCPELEISKAAAEKFNRFLPMRGSIILRKMRNQQAIRKTACWFS